MVAIALIVLSMPQKTTKKAKIHRFFIFFRPFFQIFGPQRGQISRKRVGRYKNWRGVIDKPILGLLTFGSNPEFLYKRHKKAIVPSFFMTFSLLFTIFWGPKGGCASSRLDHGLKTQPGRLRQQPTCSRPPKFGRKHSKKSMNNGLFGALYIGIPIGKLDGAIGIPI